MRTPSDTAGVDDNRRQPQHSDQMGNGVLHPSEDIVYLLECASPIVHVKENGDNERFGIGSAVLVITDRRVLLGPPDEPKSVLFREWRDATVVNRIIRKYVTISTWNKGTFRFRPKIGQNLTESIKFLRKAANCSKGVLAAIEDARKDAPELRKAITSGDESEISHIKEEINDSLSKASERIATCPNECQDYLYRRKSEADADITRVQMLAHITRSKIAASKARKCSNDQNWDQAESALRDAREHVKFARNLAKDEGFSIIQAIESELQNVVEQANDIFAHQCQLAESSREAAKLAPRGSDEAISNWADALQFTRSAIYFDWGEQLGVSKKGETLRRDVELIASRLIQACRERAKRHKATAEIASLIGDYSTAQKRYETAASYLRVGEIYSRELRAGNAESLATQRSKLVTARMLTEATK